MNEPLDMTQIGRGIKSTLTSYLHVDAQDDAPPVKEMPLQSVPIIGVRTTPVNGISLHYGTGDIPAILRRQHQEAGANGRQLYEVRVVVDITQRRILPTLDAATLVADSQRPPEQRVTQVVNLGRTKDEAEQYLRELIGGEIARLDDLEVTEWRLPRLLTRYPHLLDALASQPELSHVIMFLWEADVPGPGDGVVRQTKIATLYRRERVLNIETLNSDFVKAVLPELSSELDLDSSVSAYAQRRPQPGM
jgi:hypothetical protein